MGLVNKIMKAVEALTEDESVEKGNDFERYVVDLFDKKYFSIVQWSTDITRKHDRFVESDAGPDLTIRYIPDGEIFYVECKFRSGLYEEKLHWSKPEQLKRYQDFARENRSPFFVVIGLGGTPSHPERMFCIPLEEVKYPALYPSIFEKFERKPDKNFFWKNGFLK
ncbi:hypothetical protein RSJ42_00235 [Methanosarcina hadiensis]|uniref:hypothetical protein n=1 Tax=Methanosarcina hadiensis TaxID=3078083 RepID=UPI0039779A34